MKKLILFQLLSIISIASFSQSEIEKVNNTVLKNNIESHIYFLASDELKGRETGTPEIDIAAAYLANMLRKYGVKPIGENGSYYQNVPFEKNTPPTVSTIKIGNAEVDKVLFYKGKNTKYTGELVFVNQGLENDYKGKNVKGKWVVAKIGNGKKGLRNAYRIAQEKQNIAIKNGALGLIEYGQISDEDFNRYSHYLNEPKSTLKGNESTTDNQFAHLWVDDSDIKIDNMISSKKAIDCNIELSGANTSYFNSRNVVGVLEGTDAKLKDEYIIYSAHYDHVGIGKPNAENDSIYNGARDNAVGTVTVLSAAENIGKYPTKRSSLFILFTAEEKGLLGSKYYVENPLIPLNKMVYCFNSDNGGYNDTSKATIIGLNRTTESEHIIKASKSFGLNAIDDPAPEQGLFDRSDNVHFAKKGIPAPTFSMGFTAFDEEIGKYYHQTADNPDSIDYDYLEKFFKAYVLSCRYISNDSKETPFWTKGDKYYQSGIELYK